MTLNIRITSILAQVAGLNDFPGAVDRAEKDRELSGNIVSARKRARKVTEVLGLPDDSLQ
jgi:hypothetical protein